SPRREPWVKRQTNDEAPKGRKTFNEIHFSVSNVFRPFGALYIFLLFVPMSYDMGYMLSPLTGLIHLPLFIEFILPDC
ncbi:MAG: hypothetical protein WBP93_08470, partial [Pyrinomonadaceae bacterium]